METTGARISPNVEPVSGASRLGKTMGEMGAVETREPMGPVGPRELVGPVGPRELMGPVGPRMGMEAMGYSNCISSVSELVCGLIYEDNEAIYT